MRQRRVGRKRAGHDKAPLICLRIALLRHTVPWTADLDGLPDGNLLLDWLRQDLAIARLLSLLVGEGDGEQLRSERGTDEGSHRATPEVVLVALPLRVGQVVPLVHVQRETELALVLPEVVLHEVRILSRSTEG